MNPDQISPAVPYAGFVSRAAALCIDAAIINGSVIVVTFSLGLALSLFGGDLKPDVMTVLAGASFLGAVTIVYFSSFWTLVGQTPGMRLLRLHVVRISGKSMRVRVAIRRLIGMALSFMSLGLGFLPVLFNARRQGFHDKLAGTLVLYDPPEDP